MEVTARGWARDHGKAWIVHDKLYDVKPSPKVSIYPHNSAIIETELNENGRVEAVIYSKRVFIQANGNYQVQVKLTWKDILYLAWIVMRKRPLEALTEAFAAFKRKHNATPANNNKAA